MQNNELLQHGDTILRVLNIKDGQALIIDCTKKSMPKWVSCDALSDVVPCTDDVLPSVPNIEEIDLGCRKVAYKRYSYVASVLPFISDKAQRCDSVSRIAMENGISKQTVNYYLWLYLAYQNIAVLAPMPNTDKKPLSADEKNMRWALNKFFYTKRKNSLNTAYTMLLKEKYCDGNGVLFSQYPSFNQFRYFYRKTKTVQKYIIAREGIKEYQKNCRPLLGDGIQAFAPHIGVGMLDATICDIYLVNDSGGLVGRPILTACVDAYSSLCCGYALSWEGGVYSLRGLMLNVIADKVELCKRFGMEIGAEDWDCRALPTTLVTDMGKEYVSDTFSQITDLGVSVVNLPPYRPELKGAVEKFFDMIQSLYKPYLKGKGVIESDFQERGAHDYRKDACLTMADFERIILKCILFYNNRRPLENFPFTKDMISDGIKPYASEVWAWDIKRYGTSLITIDSKTLILTLLPRTIGSFSRKGLTVNRLRYRNDSYTERYLQGGTATVAYNPNDVSQVWLIDNGAYIPFSLIERRYDGMALSDVDIMMANKKSLVKAIETEHRQAQINLANDITLIGNSVMKHDITNIKSVRENRQREQMESHIDYLKGGSANG